MNSLKEFEAGASPPRIDLCKVASYIDFNKILIDRKIIIYEKYHQI